MNQDQRNPENRPRYALQRWTPFLAAAALLAVVGCLTQTRLTMQPQVTPSPPPVTVPTFAPAPGETTQSQSQPPTPTLPPSPVTATNVPDEPSFTELPERDRYDLAARFLGVPEAPTVSPPGEYEVGDVDTFWVVNDMEKQVFEVTAVLAYAGPHVYMWVEQGLSYDYEALFAAAERFEQRTYPTTRSYFGSEPYPGIDGDPRLHILHSTALSPQAAGYFYSPSEYPASIVSYSNEREMFFINLSNTPPGDLFYDNVLAHEFQHMIHWNVDSNEETWINEGMSELSTFLNGLGPSGFVRHFMEEPDLQLTDWPEDSAQPHYGAAFLFAAYFLDRFGQDALQALVRNPDNGLEGVESTLAEIEAEITADELFADWVIANLINDPEVADGVYAYAGLPDLEPPQVAYEFYLYPVISQVSPVHQYGTDYYRLYGPAQVRIRFAGTELVLLVPTSLQDTDGDPETNDMFAWWSNRGDDSDMTLTHRFDLRGVEEAVLEYDVWYWLESLWDYGYVEVSVDGGKTWTILATEHSTDENPHGTAYGPGYTGESADEQGANMEGWLHERVDLSAFAGQEILVRFETITDDAVNRPGLVVDNICIDAIGFCDDAETGDGEWEARGFVRHNNALKQRFVVQVVLPGEDGAIEVMPVPLGEDNQGAIEITIDSVSPAMLVVSGLTRHTTESAYYHFEIVPLE